MILKSKICGVSDTKTLKYIVNHKSPSQFIGFIVNYPKSKRYVDIKKLIELTDIDKKNSFYVAVLVNPEKDILEEIKNLKLNKELMIAGNIQLDDKLEKYKKIADIIDISGGLETSGLKDIYKIEIFLNKINNLNYEA